MTAGKLAGLFCHRDTQVKKPEIEALRQFIVERWDSLRRPIVGSRLLGTIQKDIEKQFGEDLTQGPAVIARILVDEGADLRHPEIIESDAAWRKSKLNNEATELEQIAALLGKLLNLDSAAELIKNLESMRQKFESEQDARGVTQLNALAIQARQAALSMVRNTAVEQLRVTQSEIAEWLKVWLQTPNLFDDWLELRKRSGEFRRRFPSD